MSFWETEAAVPGALSTHRAPLGKAGGGRVERGPLRSLEQAPGAGSVAGEDTAAPVLGDLGGPVWLPAWQRRTGRKPVLPGLPQPSMASRSGCWGRGRWGLGRLQRQSPPGCWAEERGDQAGRQAWHCHHRAPTRWRGVGTGTQRWSSQPGWRSGLALVPSPLPAARGHWRLLQVTAPRQTCTPGHCASRHTARPLRAGCGGWSLRSFRCEELGQTPCTVGQQDAIHGAAARRAQQAGMGVRGCAAPRGCWGRCWSFYNATSFIALIFIFLWS